ncbi:MAG: hypothetical protein NVS4B12_08160 [Ktedonobacteraceae bacterium]
MPKTKTRKHIAHKSEVGGTRQVEQQRNVSVPRRSASRSSTAASRMEAAQGMLMPAFVALGCWGLAISFLFFFPDPNHILYAGMAGAMGLIWSIIVGLRIARVLRMSREGRIYK